MNVIAERAVLTIDLRNFDDAPLQAAEQQLAAFLDRLAAQENVSIAQRNLGRFEPIAFAPEMVSLVEATAREFGFPCRRLPSGAGHDAQMMARVCPASMIFVPSVDGLSHRCLRIHQARAFAGRRQRAAARGAAARGVRVRRRACGRTSAPATRSSRTS